MNFLSLDEKTVFVMEHDIPMIDQLEGLGFKIITVPFKNVVEFGGGLHCANMQSGTSLILDISIQYSSVVQ